MRTIQISEELYQQAALLAEQDQVSVDRLVSALIREGVGEWSRIQARSARGSLGDLHRVLSTIADVPPLPEDVL